ncbi:MAG: DUF2163 domain-containing protein [Aestuariivirga sp.]
MRTLPTGLAAHLASGATTLCHCWKLTPTGSAAMGFTDHDADIAFDGVTFTASTGFEASEIESSLGLSVDNLEAAGALQSPELSPERLDAGDFRNADVEIWRVNWQDPLQRVLLRKGHVGEVRRTEQTFTAEVRGLAHVLDQSKDRVFAYPCDAVLGDARCGVDLDQPLFRGTGVVAANEDDRRFRVTGLDPFADGWFARGQLAWLTGANAGRSADVKSFRVANTVHVEIWQKAAYPVAVNDSFEIRAGCDKQFPTCKAKFSNIANYRGFPHMPGTDFVGSYAVRGDANDGGSRL